MNYRRYLSLLCAVILLCCYMMPVYASASKAFHTSYLYFGNPGDYLAMVEQARGSIDEISPNYFTLLPDGSLQESAVIKPDFIRQMHGRNIRVVPFLSNYWDANLARSALAHRVRLTDQIAEAVQKYELDGVQIDLENLTRSEREYYYEFVKLLREKIPSQKTVAVAVAANPFAYTDGWQASYDYEKLGTVADYLMIMAYDEHYEGGSPGSITSLNFAKKSIEYALQYVPPEKIVLGLPFYGRIWGGTESSVHGQGISDARIQELIRQYKTELGYDEKTQSATAQITVSQQDAPLSVGGNELGAGRYVIWYSDESSKKALLRLVKDYHLKGAGSWSLGQEQQNTWSYFSLWLNGLAFSDVQGHWAMQDIVSVATSGTMKGISENAFAPDRFLTRAEAAVILVRLLHLPLDSPGAGYFRDTSLHWAKQEIASAQKHGLLTGFENQLFSPDRSITRQEMAVLLDRALSNQLYLGNQPSAFSDVDRQANHWSYEAILHLSAAGILQGYPDGSFHPDESVTRAQMSVILNRIARQSDLT